MPINFDLEELRNKFNCNYFFETGLYEGKGSEKALNCKFKKCFCIEIREDLCKNGEKKFKNYIEKGNYFIYLDDSSNLKKYILNEDFNKNKTIFFLDAHVDNKNIHNYKKNCPLFEELDAIQSLERKDNIILIDDLRILKKEFPWGEKSYGNINFLQQIMNKILLINKNYKFATLDGLIKDDVLVAFI